MNICEGKDGVFKNVEDAIKYMESTNFEGEVCVYDIDTNKAYKKVSELYKVIKEYNKGKPLDEQILPGNPYGYRAIVGSLGVQAYSISLGTYKRNHDLIALFTGWNTSVLDRSNEKPNITPSLKALSSIAMIAGYMKNN